MPRAAALVLTLVLTLLTGFTGLVYQVTWQKYLATLLGSHSEATAAVLGIFLGGLSVGYSLFGTVTSRLIAPAFDDLAGSDEAQLSFLTECRAETFPGPKCKDGSREAKKLVTGYSSKFN